MNGISVIIPVYNREDYLGEAIRSVLAQEYSGPLEIIVSDDGSSDRSVGIAGDFGEKVRVVHKPDGCMTQGASGTRNRGIARATQPYVAFLDSDDFYLPGHLNRMAGILERRPDLGFVVSRVVQTKELNGRRVFAPWTKARVTQRDISYPVVSGSNVVHTDAFLFRRSVFQTVGIFDEAYSNHEDSDLWMRISERYRGTFSDHYGAVYRLAHGEGQLTDARNAGRNAHCLEQVLLSALARCRAAERPDRYRLFRLRLMIARFGRPFWRALMCVAVRHPLLTVTTALSIARIRNRLATPEWTESVASAIATHGTAA